MVMIREIEGAELSVLTRFKSTRCSHCLEVFKAAGDGERAMRVFWPEVLVNVHRKCLREYLYGQARATLARRDWD